jgi:hypothetical protein
MIAPSLAGGWIPDGDHVWADFGNGRFLPPPHRYPKLSM